MVASKATQKDLETIRFGTKEKFSNWGFYNLLEAVGASTLKFGVASSPKYLITSDCEKRPRLCASVVNVVKQACMGRTSTKDFPFTDIRVLKDPSDFFIASGATLVLTISARWAHDDLWSESLKLFLHSPSAQTEAHSPLERQTDIVAAKMDQFALIPCSAAWRVIPAFSQRSGEELQFPYYVIVVSSTAPSWKKEEIDAAAAKLRALGFSWPATAVNKRQTVVKDVGGTIFSTKDLLKLAQSTYSSWEARHRPGMKERIKRDKEAEDAKKAKRKSTGETFCPNCTCAQCTAKKQKRA